MTRCRGPVRGTVRTPRQVNGDRAEAVAADYLVARGWTILARNVRVGRSEVDLVAREPAGMLVIVEVRSHTVARLGAPEELVDATKVARLYAAARTLLRSDRSPADVRPVPFRIDLVTVVRDTDGRWRPRRHLRGLTPP